METVIKQYTGAKLTRFQKDLIVWKREEFKDKIWYEYRFQKDLIVWKLRTASDKPSVFDKFQKDLIVWKLIEGREICNRSCSVSEGLNSVETLIT